MSSETPFVIGIDLGTTNTALAYCDTRLESNECKVFDIPQIVRPGEVETRSVLPSFIYIPGDSELPEGALELPWGEYSYTAGVFARDQGSRITHRLVSSAKSWLCNPNVLREDPILPWTADSSEVNKISPVEASMRYLTHLCESWHTKHNPMGDECFSKQSIFLTVPASFDASARELTVKSAIASDMDVILLEEPQAALYSWLYSKGDEWRNYLSLGDTVLVCDVGGGTTDFSLMAVCENDGELELVRIAVGDHILLGGDNMDLALAMVLSAKLKSEKGMKLDSWQINALSLLCREAKESLFINTGIDEVPIVIPSRGSKLFADSVSTILTRDILNNVILEGFFPQTPFDRHPVKKTAVGFTELSLPYEQDPSISSHLARFLSLHQESLLKYGNSKFPKAILFNGGVFKSSLIKDRFFSLLNTWHGDKDIKLLDGGDLDLAVCKGAAYYGLARRGKGIRIRGGTSRSYYVGIESSMPSIPGFEPPVKALCLAPKGVEEGTEITLPEKEFGLQVGEEAVFKFLSSSVRNDDKTGDIIEDWEDDISELPQLKMSLESDDKDTKIIPVKLETHITEIGTIELWCVSDKLNKKWKLEFDIRSDNRDF